MSLSTTFLTFINRASSPYTNAPSHSLIFGGAKEYSSAKRVTTASRDY